MRCCATTHSQSFKEIHEERQRLKVRSRELTADEPVHIQVRYYVVYENQSENIPLKQVQAQHDQLNLDFNMLNPDTELVPSTGMYNFASVRGNPKVTFLPIETELQEDVEVIRVPILNEPTDGYAGLDAVESAVISATGLKLPEVGILNVYICRLEGNTLGQAYLFSNHCVIRSGTVGSFENPGTTTGFDIGRTATHEIGHAFGLPHTFTHDEECPEESYFSDIPRQKLPNYNAVLEAGGGSLDNRYRDCNSPSFNIPGVSPPYLHAWTIQA